MRKQKEAKGVWAPEKPYVQQKDEYLSTGLLKALRDALKNALPSGQGRRS